MLYIIRGVPSNWVLTLVSTSVKMDTRVPQFVPNQFAGLASVYQTVLIAQLFRLSLPVSVQEAQATAPLEALTQQYCSLIQPAAQNCSDHTQCTAIATWLSCVCAGGSVGHQKDHNHP